VLGSNRLARHSRSGFRGNGYETWVCEGAGADAALPLAIERARLAPLHAASIRREIARREAGRAAEVELVTTLAQKKIAAYDAATQCEREALAAQEREIADADTALAALRGAT
jgi:hypothetical protein